MPATIIDSPEITNVEDQSNFKSWLDVLKSTEAELLYRQWMLQEDKKLISSNVIFAIAGITLFLIIDLRLHDLVAEFKTIILGRFMLLMLFIGFFILVKKALSIKQLDWVTAFLFISIECYELYVIYLLPDDFFVHIGTDIMIIFLCYVASPISAIWKLFICGIFSIASLLLLFMFKENSYNITYAGFSLSLITANAFGYWIAVQQGRVRRKSYLYLMKERKARDDIKTLEGIIPICSYCKNIRDDEGSWKQLEAYIYNHSEAKFSHGICPNCLPKFSQ